MDQDQADFEAFLKQRKRKKHIVVCLISAGALFALAGGGYWYHSIQEQQEQDVNQAELIKSTEDLVKVQNETRQLVDSANADIQEKIYEARCQLIEAHSDQLNTRQKDWLIEHAHDDNFDNLLKRKLQEHMDESK